MTGTTFNAILRVKERAEEMGIVQGSIQTLAIDLLNAEKTYNMNWEGLANADDANFSHDVIGIQRHIDRGIATFDPYFVPRFALPYGEKPE